MDIEELKTALPGTIPRVKMSGFRIDLFKKRLVRLSVSAKPQHMNHVGMVYAGIYFIRMEVVGAALFFTTYRTKRFTPNNKAMRSRFLKPASSDIACEFTFK
jgi:acyl-coenzyme A thioesterase PaaI-like protein